MIKTYRGNLADGGQDKIRLKTLKGEIGYRIVKFQMLPPDSHENVESTMKIYTVSQTSIDDDIDFSDQTLLAAGILLFPQHSSNTAAKAIVFDNVIFNQDIYITLSGHGYQASINYYLELEQVMLNENETTMATLQSLRTVAER